MASPAAYSFDESKLLWTPVHPGHAICERLRREINMKHGLKLSASIPQLSAVLALGGVTSYLG